MNKNIYTRNPQFTFCGEITNTCFRRNYIISLSTSFFYIAILNSILFCQNIEDSLQYSINIDTIIYTVNGTINWSMEFTNLSSDTLEFSGFNQRFYEWKIITESDSLVAFFPLISPPAVFILPPDCTLTDNWPQTIAHFNLAPPPYWAMITLNIGNYYGLMKPWAINGSLEYDTVAFQVVELLNISNQINSSFLPSILNNPYPNPTNSNTNIEFSIPNNGLVNLAIYDINGRFVTNLLNKRMPSGFYKINWNSKSESSGIYFIILSQNNITNTEKIILTK